MSDEPIRRPCPWCAEMILPAAMVCRFCGRDVDPVQLPAPADVLMRTPTDLANRLFEAVEALAVDPEDADATLLADEVGAEILRFEPGAALDLPTATWRVVRRSARDIVEAINANGDNADELIDFLGEVACRIEADLRTAAAREGMSTQDSSGPDADIPAADAEPTPVEADAARETAPSEPTREPTPPARPSEDEFVGRLAARLALLKGDSRELAKAVLMGVTKCDLATANTAIDALPKSYEIHKCVEVAAIQGTLSRDIEMVVTREREKQRRASRGCGWTLALLALGLVIWLVVIPIARTLSKPDNPEPERSEQTVDRVAAIDPCHDSVSSQLKSPSTAGFESWLTGEGEWEQSSDTSGTYSGHVDAQNGFGSEVRSEYTCEVSVGSDGNIVAVATLYG